jgi:hypothetical protein
VLLAGSGGPFSISDIQTFNVDISSTTGIRLQWGPNATQVPVDNVDFTVSPIAIVPEPSSLVFLIAGTALLALRPRWSTGK